MICIQDLDVVWGLKSGFHQSVLGSFFFFLSWGLYLAQVSGRGGCYSYRWKGKDGGQLGAAYGWVVGYGVVFPSEIISLPCAPGRQGVQILAAVECTTDVGINQCPQFRPWPMSQCSGNLPGLS